jgi:hypothetical protein
MRWYPLAPLTVAAERRQSATLSCDPSGQRLVRERVCCGVTGLPSFEVDHGFSIATVGSRGVVGRRGARAGGVCNRGELGPARGHGARIERRLRQRGLRDGRGQRRAARLDVDHAPQPRHHGADSADRRGAQPRGRRRGEHHHRGLGHRPRDADGSCAGRRPRRDVSLAPLRQPVRGRQRPEHVRDRHHGRAPERQRAEPDHDGRCRRRGPHRRSGAHPLHGRAHPTWSSSPTSPRAPRSTRTST